MNKIERFRRDFPQFHWKDLSDEYHDNLWFPHPLSSHFFPCIIIYEWSELRELLEKSHDYTLPIFTEQGPFPEVEEGLCVDLRLPENPPPMQLDEESYLLTCDSRYSLEAVESYARAHGLTAGFRVGFRQTLAHWIAEGNPLVSRIGGLRNPNPIFACEAILPDGSVLNASSHLDAQHLDWSKFCWGKGGTLGIVTSVTLRLLPETPYPPRWQLSFHSPEAALFLLKNSVRRWQPPIEMNLTLDLLSEEAQLYLQLDPEKTPCICERIRAYSSLSEPTTPPHFAPTSPYWLACSERWERLPQFIRFLKKNPPFPLRRLSLAALDHATATLFMEFQIIDEPDRYSRKLQKFVQESQQEGRFFWGDPRYLPTLVSSPVNRAILRAFKRQIDPQFLLNPHLL